MNSNKKENWNRLKPSSFPLLQKELIELSNRFTTYSIRIVYALIMYGLCAYIFSNTISSGALSEGYGIIGTGNILFGLIYSIQLIGICLFVPAITCTAISSEKETGNFPLLLVTRLGPATIVIEKLMSRLIQFGTVLLLALPLMAYAYILGGVEMTRIWQSSILMFLCMLQLASFSIMCSCFCRTNMASFIMTYFLGVVIQIFLPVMTLFIMFEYFSFLDTTTPNPITYLFYSWVSFISAPVACLAYSGDTVMALMGNRLFYTMSFSMLASTCIYILLAKRFLVTRVFVPSGSSTLRIFKSVDKFMKRINQNRVTKGIVLIKDGETLPEEDPIAWRETTKTALGATRYLVRLLVAVEVPLILFIFFAISLSFNYSSMISSFSLLYYLLWFLAVILIVAKAANLLTGEQANQTLDVLLSTPIPTQDILRQKFKGIKRLFWVLAIPLLTLMVIGFFILSLEMFNGFHFDLKPEKRNAVLSLFMFKLFQFVFRAIAIVIYFHIVMYLTLWISLTLKKNLKTIIATIVILGLWVFGISAILISLQESFLSGDNVIYNYSRGYRSASSLQSSYSMPSYMLMDMVLVMNPAEMLRSMGVEKYSPGYRYLYFVKGIVSSLFYLSVMYLMKWRCYRKILKELKRPEGLPLKLKDQEFRNEKSVDPVEPVSEIS